MLKKILLHYIIIQPFYRPTAGYWGLLKTRNNHAIGHHVNYVHVGRLHTLSENKSGARCLKESKHFLMMFSFALLASGNHLEHNSHNIHICMYILSHGFSSNALPLLAPLVSDYPHFI